MYSGERAPFLMRRIACTYFKSMPGVNDFRARINRLEDIDTMREMIQDFDATPVDPLSVN